MGAGASNITMRGHRAGLVQGWVVSAMLHATLVGAIAMGPPTPPVLELQEVFRWEVSLVANPATASISQDAPAPSATRAKTAPHARRQATGVRQHATPAVRQEGTAVRSVAPPPVQALSRLTSVDEAPREEVRHEEVVRNEQPSTADDLSQAPAVASIESVTTTAELQARQDVSPSAERADRGDSETPPASVPTVVASQGSPPVGNPMRPDYGWLGQALRARIEEVKRYSVEARANAWEGRVVVAAAILADGRIVEIRVIESSGNRQLDEDAQAIMEQVSPLMLSRSIGSAKVTVKVPMIFGLQ